MRAILILSAILLATPALALDCDGGKLVVGKTLEPYCEPLSEADIAQREADNAAWEAEQAKPKAPTVEEQIAALKAEIEALKSKR